MKYTLPALLLLFFLASCDDDDTITGSGNLVDVPYEFTGFSTVEASHGFSVTITHSDTSIVTVTADDNVTDLLEVTQAGGTIYFGVKEGSNLKEATLRAEVMMPEFEALRVSSGAMVTIDGDFPDIDSFDADIESGAKVSGGSLQTTMMEWDVSAGSSVKLGGASPTGLFKVEGGSTFDLRDHELFDCTLDASGGSTVYVNVSGTLNVNASGGAQVFYTGEPTLGDINVSGGATLKILE